MTDILDAWGIPTNGYVLEVKDPNAAADTLFADYVYVPGIASLTLPNEVGSNNETPTLHGQISAAAYKGVGQLTAEIAGLVPHPSIQFLHERSEDQKVVQLRLRREAENVLVDASGVVGSVAAAGTEITVKDDAGKRNLVKQNVRAGMILALADAISDNYIDYKAVPAMADDHKWRSIVSVDENGSSIVVAPAITTAIAPNASEKILVRQPGTQWVDLGGVVNGFATGDIQNSSNVSGSLTFTPRPRMPFGRVYHKIALD